MTTIKMTEENMKIKIGMFDNKNQFLGYKVDSLWSIDAKNAKIHNSKNGEIPSAPIENLEYICNEWNSPERFAGNKIATFCEYAVPTIQNALKIYELARNNKNKYFVNQIRIN